MKEYVAWIAKRILRRKSNIIVMLCSIAVLAFVLVMNMRTQRLYDNIESQIALLHETIEEYQEKLPGMNENDMEYTLASETLRYHKEELSLYEELKHQYLANDWDLFYTTYETVKKRSIEVMENTMMTSENESSITQDLYHYELKDLAYIQYLHEHQLPYEDQGYPIYGLSFLTFVSEYIAPILILLCCVYIMSQAFTLDYAKGIDVSKLLPIGRKTVFYTKALIGLGSSLIVFFIILGVAFFLASILNFNAGLDVPVILQNSSGDWSGAPMISYVFQWVLLGTGFYICVSMFILMLSLWIKEDLTLLITTLCILLGLAYLPILLPAMKEIAHYTFTTYLNYTSVVMGNLAEQYGNRNLSFSFGMIVLFLSSACMFAIGSVKIRLGQCA